MLVVDPISVVLELVVVVATVVAAVVLEKYLTSVTEAKAVAVGLQLWWPQHRQQVLNRPITCI